MKTITINTTVNLDVGKVWNKWTTPADIMKWNQASADWHCPKATNDLVVGGRFSATMAAIDGSASFEFGGVYSKVIPETDIEYAMDDNRKVAVHFEKIDDTTTSVTETFDMETENSEEKQREGWQAILDNFKKYCEFQS